MSRHDALLGALPLLILKIVGQRGPMHGYALTTHIETTSEDVLRVMEGSLYPALHRMEEAGWIRARWATTERQRRVRIYAITAHGRRQLEAEEQRWHAVTGAVGRVLKHA
jgi:transcriptional regulator